MTLQEFINKWNGKGIDFDGSYGYQCMDLMHQYIKDVFGLGGEVLRAPTAYQAFLNGHPEFKKFNYIQGMTPQSGDIMFWNDKYVEGTGHVSVFIDGGTTSFTSLDQNWPVGSITHKQNHNYQGVAGWLRYKKQEQSNENNNDIRMIKFVEDKRIAWVKTKETIDDYWLIIDGKKRRKIKKEDYELMVPLFGQYGKLKREDWGAIAKLEEGDEFDYYNTLITHPEYFESI